MKHKNLERKRQRKRAHAIPYMAKLDKLNLSVALPHRLMLAAAHDRPEDKRNAVRLRLKLLQ